MSFCIKDKKPPYINELLEIQLRRLGKDKKLVIIDVGAYDGLNCVRLARRFRNATIYAIEPYTLTYRTLRQNVSRYKNVIPCKLAISDKRGIEKIYSPVGTKEEDTVRSLQSVSLYQDFSTGKMPSKVRRTGRTQSVITRTLFNFCKRRKIKHIDLLKVNCEGGEYQIFCGDSDISSVLDFVNIINLSLHGKSLKFRSKKYMKKKKEINQLLSKNFKIIYGQDTNKLTEMPQGHINQVWIRKKFI